jgi:Ca-activated chloride channel family protein
MFDFAWPWMVILLPLPWVAWRFWPMPPSRAELTEIQKQPALLHPALARLEKAFSSAAPSVPRSDRLPMFLLGLLWLCLVGAMMQPQWLRHHIEIRNKGYDLMIAVDLSRSMLALDFTVDNKRVNRLQVVKGVLGRFIEQRQGDRLGLLFFGDAAYTQSPLTLDTAAVRRMLDASVPRMAGDATAIGDVIGLAVKKLRDRPESSRVMILLTDGENTAGSLPPEQAALLAAQYKIRIYSIGVGSMGDKEGKVPFPDETGRIVQEEMKIDEDLMRRVAALTGGAYFRATDTQALEEIYKNINTLEKTEAETRSVMIPEPLYRWPLGAALLVLLTLAGLGIGRGRVSL